MADLLVSRKVEQGRDKDHVGRMNAFLRLVGTLIRFYLSVVSPLDRVGKGFYLKLHFSKLH